MKKVIKNMKNFYCKSLGFVIYFILTKFNRILS